MIKRHNSIKSDIKKPLGEEDPIVPHTLSSLFILISIVYLYALIALLKALILQNKTAKFG